MEIKEGTLSDSVADPDMIKQLIKKLNSLEVIEFLSFNPTQNQLNTSEFENNSESIQIKFSDTSTITILVTINLRMQRSEKFLYQNFQYYV